MSEFIRKPKAKVMLLGVFHFSNPQQDVVKTKQINVMTNENQEYLERLTSYISKFSPTIILLEFDPLNEQTIQEQYNQYRKGDFALPSNEIYQLGFRIAQKSNLTTVHSFDERTIEWNAEPFFDYINSNDLETKSRLDTLIEKITSETEQAHQTHSLFELLIDANIEEKDSLNKYLYLLTNHVGAGGSFEGADAAASWWHRNFRMYANIQRYATLVERVLVIGGQGHTAILKDLLKIDQDREAVDFIQFLSSFSPHRA